MPDHDQAFKILAKAAAEAAKSLQAVIDRWVEAEQRQEEVE